MRPFVYQILDTSHLKSNSPLNPKLLAIRLIMSVGVRAAQHIFFLGKHTRSEVEEITRMKFDESNSTIVHNGLSRLFIDLPSANCSKSELIKLPYSPDNHQLQTQLLKSLNLQKPYFLFVSVWRPYKNILRLAQAFDRFNVDNKYQLVLAGKVDPKYSSIKDEVTKLKQFTLGNIVITGMIQSDEDIVLLQDGALAFVGPSLSEGFGLWIVESASRGTPILCSNIEVFQNLLDPHSACFFDGKDVNDIAKSLTKFVNLDKNIVNQLAVNAHTVSTQYRWSITAHTIHTMISRYELKN